METGTQKARGSAVECRHTAPESLAPSGDDVSICLTLLKNGGRHFTKEDVRMTGEPWPDSSVGWSIVSVCQGCGFDLQSGHRQEATDE